MNPEHCVLHEQARHHQTEQRWSQAIRCYEQLLKDLPEEASLWHELGLIYVQTDDLADALNCLETAAGLSPENPNMLNNLGNAQKATGQIDAARTSYQRAIALNPDYAEAWHNLARLYHLNQQPDKALRAWEKALHIRPDYHDAHFSLGLLFLKQKDLQAAMIQFENVLRLNPENVQAHFYLAVMALHEEQLDKANHHLQTVLHYDPEQVESLVNMGVLLLKKQHDQEAIHYFTKALALDNKHLEARNNLAATFMHHDRYENALQHYSVLLETEPDNIEYLYNSGVAQMALGHLAEAKQCFLRIHSINPYHHPSLNNLAAISLRLDDHPNAIQYLEKALIAKPDDNISQHLLSALQGNHQQQKSCPEYARNLFDNYALYYDKHLRETLHYQLPEAIEQLLQVYQIDHRQNSLDLGCGSGLCGEILRPHSVLLTGVDISPKMLAQAKAKQLYDTLTEEEIVVFLTEQTMNYDLIVAADVLPYFGELAELFDLIHQRLSANGYVIFSVENNAHTPWLLQNTGRFSHQHSYIEDLAQSSHLNILTHKTIQGRTQNNQPLRMGLYLLQKSHSIEDLSP